MVNVGRTTHQKFLREIAQRKRTKEIVQGLQKRSRQRQIKRASELM